MDSHYETIKTPATAEYVFSVFTDQHRLICDWDGSFDPDFILTMDSTIKDWRNTDDLPEWKSLGKALNTEFSIQLGDSEWKSILEPASTRTLGELCERIAKDTFQEKIKPVNILGKTCLKGGIFLTIRSKLAEAGASVEKLSPSSDLALYSRNYLRVFLEISNKLFPGKFPVFVIHKPFYDFTIRVLFLSWVALILGGIVGKFVNDGLGAFVIALGATGAFVSYLLTFPAAAASPDRVELGNLKTFRDLVNTISEPQASGN